MKNIFSWLCTPKKSKNTAEDAAVKFLRRQGLQLIARNYRCRFGEIDIVMQDQKYLIFIEVRERNNKQFASPFESINQIKQKKIITTAKFFLAEKKISNGIRCRFDAVGIQEIKGKQTIQWLKNAFEEELF